MYQPSCLWLIQGAQLQNGTTSTSRSKVLESYMTSGSPLYWPSSLSSEAPLYTLSIPYAALLILLASTPLAALPSTATGIRQICTQRVSYI